jgi:nicotinate-nucleotide pyrophosphorylase (carboxylating)
VKVDFIDQATFNSYLDTIIDLAFEEDIREGDHTSLSTIPDNAQKEAKLLVKDDGIIAGIELAKYIFKKFDNKLRINTFKKDGDIVKQRDIAFIVSGPARSIFTSERLVLNFMQRLSGIATQTYNLSEKIKQYGTKLLDTRKTTPGLRLLEKWAVGIGGGTNHRIGLYDMILVKDNHVDYAGGITQAHHLVEEYKKINNLNIPVEFEIRTFEELDEVLKLQNIDRILLDNFSPEGLKKAVSIVDKRMITEASGGINKENIVDYAKSGVDYISSGSLTHTVVPMDLSLKIIS